MSLDDQCQADKPRNPDISLHNEPIEGFEGLLGNVLAKTEGSWGGDWLAQHKRG